MPRPVSACAASERNHPASTNTAHLSTSHLPRNQNPGSTPETPVRPSRTSRTNDTAAGTQWFAPAAPYDGDVMAIRYTFPFTAIVGQERMKLALCLNAVHPRIGGVLIRGERGTGKSTAVRALTRLLPAHAVVDGCHFGCDPDDARELCWQCRGRLAAGERPLPRATRRMRVVELPINASEDRVVGTIDLEAALKEGSRRFEPGVLAEANRNILYVDEVNLLDDHIVDVLLDAAAMGVNVVE